MSWLDEGSQAPLAPQPAPQPAQQVLAPPPPQNLPPAPAVEVQPAAPAPVAQLPVETPQPRTEAPAASKAMGTREGLTHLIQSLAVDGVSDLHFIAGGLAWVVKFGRPVKTSVEVSSDAILAWADEFGADHGGRERLMNSPAGTLETMDFVGPVGAQLRLRMAFRRQATGVALTVRLVPEIPPRLTDSVFHTNPIPKALIDLTLNAPAGLILFCGPTGSGKTTVTAALLAEVNNTQNKHIYTIEDPIEFIHTSDMSVISQREIGLHAETFAGALRAAMRARPNIILIGELLDLETVRVAIEAANKGHLVFATSHASSAEEAVSSIVSQFPGGEQSQVATALSQSLKAVLVQRLIPTIEGRVVPARELMLSTVAIASKIRGMDFTGITQALRPTDGTWTFEDDLAVLWAQGLIDEEAVFTFCNSQSDMEQKLAHAQKNREVVASRANRKGN